MQKPIDLIGRRFNSLTVVSRSGINGNSFYECSCECGNRITLRRERLLRMSVKSCGCHLPPSKRHQVRSSVASSNCKGVTPGYKSWEAMRNRCLRPTFHKFPHYGGRGIKICDRWMKSFKNFITDMGPRPSPNHSLDRIDNDGDYTPENCRWADRYEQANNMSTNRLVQFNGKTQTLAMWGRELGFHKSLIPCRLRNGWSMERAMSTPPRPRPKK